MCTEWKVFINVAFLSLYCSSFTTNQHPSETQKQENCYLIKWQLEKSCPRQYLGIINCKWINNIILVYITLVYSGCQAMLNWSSTKPMNSWEDSEKESTGGALCEVIIFSSPISLS